MFVGRCSVLSLALVVSCWPGIGSTGAKDDVVQVSFLEISPNRKLPVLSQVSMAILDLETHGRLVNSVNAVESVRDTNEHGWKSSITPDQSVSSLDDYQMSITSNDIDRASREAPAIFDAMGFIPITDPGENSDVGVVAISISFFGHLAFVYDGPLPVVVLRREEGRGEYQLVGTSTRTEGTVVQRVLDGRSVFLFSEDHHRTLSGMTKEYPVPMFLALWDDEGNRVLQMKYDQLEWADGRLVIVRNTRSLAAPCGRASSSFHCRTSGESCQYSLLDPKSGEPMIQQTLVRLAYENGQLRTTTASLRAESASGFSGDSVSCADFQSRTDILNGSGFGVCGMNIDGAHEWRCLGDSRLYYQESLDLSKQYWSMVQASLTTCPKGRVEISSTLAGVFANLEDEFRNEESPGSFVARGLGYREAVELAGICP